MTLSVGTQLGPYEILSLAGAGGMGEVYRAKDTKLGREVAIKLLPEAFARDPERSARFEREAKVLAALNHPNIAAIYGLEQSALVMELVDGDSPKGPMSFDDAWHIAAQMVAALEYAHDRGIVHRDLKPANIKITEDGVVKLLDFGLAKAFNEPATAAPSDLSNSPTLTMATEVGMILGTAAYMAPEQAKGRSVDKRADIWAFGVVLYELLTGQQLFKGEDVSETLAQVLTKRPDWNQVPVKARRLLEACLEKDPKQRVRDIGDTRRLLEEVQPQPKPIQTRNLLLRFASIALGILLIPAAIVSIIHFRETPPATPVIRTTILPPEDTTFEFNFNSGIGLFALSPDGQKIVLSARSPDGKSQLWIRFLDGLEPKPLAGTENAAFPFWSPDSRFIAFFADGKLKKIDTSGGPPVSLSDAPVGRGGTWGKDNVIVFAPSNNDPLHKVSASGGPRIPVTKFEREEGPQRLPWFLPDGKHFLYRVQGSRDTAIRIGSIDSEEPKMVGPASSNAVYTQGFLFFRRDSTLMAQPFDERSLAATGEAIPVAENVDVGLSAGFFSVSETGLLVYQSSRTPSVTGDPADMVLAWIDRDGKQLERLRDPGDIGDIQFAPDRMKFAYTLWGSTATNRDIWIYDLTRQLPSRFSFDPAAERYPIWSPDGSSIIFVSSKRQFPDIYRKRIDSTSGEELLWESNQDKEPTSWSPDGKFVLVNNYSASGKAGTHIWKLSLIPERPGDRPQPSVFLDTGSFSEIDGQFSPDGRWVAYSSNESQRFEVYVTSFPNPGGKRQISLEGGVKPRWRPDGKEIYYVDLNSRLRATEILSKDRILEVGSDRQVGGGVINSRGYLYDVHTDGKRLLTRVIAGAVQPAQRQFASEPLTLIYNWPALLKQ